MNAPLAPLNPQDPKTRRKGVNFERLRAIGREILECLGEDPNREGLVDTPKRWASFLRDFMAYEPGNCDATFESVQTDQLVVVRGIRVWSLCEHHMLPFWTDLSIGYLTGPRVLGLSKFARVAHDRAHGLQIQERLVREIAEDISTLTGSESVAVIGEGVHLCMVMRGIRTEGTMITSAMKGRFRQNLATREEFLSIVRGGGGSRR